MEMTIEMAKDADIILNTVIEKGPADFHWYDRTIFNQHPKHYTNTLFILMNSIEEEVVGKSEHGYSIKETYKTRTFIRDGGFTNVVHKRIQIQKEKDKEEKMTREKLYHDLKISKWMRKTYWLTFILSLLAILISIYSLFKK